ncbi:hypothetical protein [Aurantiacibacter marinus]|uniref:GDT1 family protein n=1 Tax=Aurantiacibacter marinus TaxID=874156 RepID=A0A0H0XLV5_9SPHN|nr:hypothetical protein [Aurantiacibacter marinus]KLI62991.1 hypothetical protein AAV99_13220 [Aurantiacibacter marinus]
MTAFFLSFLGVGLAMLAGREGVRVSRIAGAGASEGSLIAMVAVIAIAACALAALLAGEFAQLLSSHQQSWFVAAALVLAGLEVIFLDAPKAPSEPTRSLGAVGIVLFAGVLADASGLLIISLSIATGAPGLVAGGGALAVAGVLGAAAMAGPAWEKLPRLPMRWTIGIILLASALIIAFSPPEVLT